MAKSKDFEFDQQQPGISGSRHVRPGRSFMRMLIWFFVFIWCMIPFVWGAGMLATSFMDASNASKAKDKDKKKSSPDPDFERWPSPSPSPTSSTSPAVSPLYAVLSSSIMFMLLGYALWCAAGVICGLGMERAWAALAGSA